MPLPRVYPICDTQSLRTRGVDPVVFSQALIEAGATILQVRNKDAWDREAVARLQAISELCASAGCRLVVNDRADLAAICGAGVHVGQDDLPPADARAIAGQHALVGFSTHNEAQLLASEAEPADYLALGPVFPTASKQNPDPTLGLVSLRSLRSRTPKPLVAIGGITRETAASVLAAGADSIAVIGDLIPDELTPGAFRARMKEWLEATR